MAALKKSLEKDLDKFRSTFEVDTTNLTKDRVRSLIQTQLDDDLENTIKSEDEEIKKSNFLSYLYSLLKEKDHALQFVEDSLQKDPDNIIANANKARILLEDGNVSEVEEILAKLQELRKRSDFDKRKCYAEADLAYTYSRLGPSYHQRAVELFNRIVKAYPTEYTWQFGLGLILLRRAHHFYSKENAVEAARILQAATNSADPIVCAKAYAKLGRAIFNMKKYKYRNLPPEIEWLRDRECFIRALEICPEEPSVLQDCGQFARYRNNLDKSERLLRKSLRIKPTPRGYHHLALTLQTKVEMQTGRSTERESGRNPDFDCMSHNRGKRHKLRQSMKSPFKVQIYPRNKWLVEAIEFIEKVEKLDPATLNMQYDKGILYRMLGETVLAAEVFQQIVFKREYLATKALMTIAYEQLGLCLLELSNLEEQPPDTKTKYKNDGQTHLSHALQLQSEIVADEPQFKQAWNSYSTLQNLLSDGKIGKPKQLEILHMLIVDHKNSIAIYKELLLKEDKMEYNDCENMLKCHMKSKQFEECVTLVSLWECTTIFERLPPSLIFDVYINGAFHAYATENVQLAYKHFRRAFQVYGILEKAIDDQTEAGEEEDTKDILILHSCSQGWRCRFPRNLGTILQNCTGLRYTINADNVLENPITTQSMISMMQKIPCIIIMIHDNANKYNQFYVNHAVQMSLEKGGPRVLVVADDKCNVPDIARTSPFIWTPPSIEDAMQPTDQIPHSLPVRQIEWVREFINLLKDQHRK